MSSEASHPPRGGQSSRAHLKRNYKEQPPPMGVFAIRNRANGKVFVGSSLNVNGALNRARFELTTGIHRTFPGLQEDWGRSGADAFSFEVLDVLKPSEEPSADPKEELKVLEALWLDRLGPNAVPAFNAPPK